MYKLQTYLRSGLKYIIVIFILYLITKFFIPSFSKIIVIIGIIISCILIKNNVDNEIKSFEEALEDTKKYI